MEMAYVRGKGAGPAGLANLKIKEGLLYSILNHQRQGENQGISDFSVKKSLTPVCCTNPIIEQVFSPSGRTWCSPWAGKRANTRFALRPQRPPRILQSSPAVKVEAIKAAWPVARAW